MHVSSLLITADVTPLFHYSSYYYNSYYHYSSCSYHYSSHYIGCHTEDYLNYTGERKLNHSFYMCKVRCWR